MDDKFEDRSNWIRWSTQEYEEEAYKRASSVISGITAGRHPMGVINLLSGLKLGVWYPYKEQAERIAGRIWQQLQHLIEEANLPELQRYNFEIFVREAGTDLENKSLATIVFRYNPDDVRDLSLDNPE